LSSHLTTGQEIQTSEVQLLRLDFLEKWYAFDDYWQYIVNKHKILLSKSSSGKYEEKFSSYIKKDLFPIADYFR